jgi:WD40 repeat protein
MTRGRRFWQPAVIFFAFGVIGSRWVHLSESAQPPDPLTSAWQDLAANDATAAYRAIWQLAGHPEEAVKLIGRELAPAGAPDDARIRGWIADLRSDQFAVRDRATRELEKQAELAGVALKRALADTPDLETRRRVEILLDRLPGTTSSPEKLRAIRAVETLETIATAEARVLLGSLAKGHATNRLTREATESVARLDERQQPGKTWAGDNRPFAGDTDPLLACVRTRLGTTRFRHQGAVRPESVRFCGGDRYLASLDSDGVISIWDAQDGTPYRRLNASASALAACPQGTVLAYATFGKGEGKVAIVFWDWQNVKEAGRTELIGGGIETRFGFSPDGKQLICCGIDSVIHYLDSVTCKELCNWKVSENPKTLQTVSPDGKRVIVDVGDLVFAVLTADGVRKEISGFRGTTSGKDFVFSPNGEYLATGIFTGSSGFRLWDLATMKVVWMDWHGADWWGRPRIFSGDGKFLAGIEDRTGQILVWDTQSGKCIKTLAGSAHFGAATFSSDGRHLAAVSGHAIRVWNLETGRPHDLGDGLYTPATHFTFFSTRGLLATDSPGVDYAYRLWDPITGKQIKVVMADGTYIDGAVYSPDATLLATSGNTLDLWNVETGLLVYRLTGHRRLGGVSRSIRFSADCHYLWSWGASDFFVRKWYVKTGKLLAEFRLPAESNLVDDPDEAEASVRFLTGGLLGSPAFGQFTRRGNQFLLATHDGKIQLRDRDSGKTMRAVEVGTDKEPYGLAMLALSHDEKHIIVGRRGQATVHDLATGAAHLTIPRSNGRSQYCFSPDGRSIAIASGNKISFVESASGKTRLVMENPLVTDSALAFSPDGQVLISGMSDTTTWIWDIAALATRGQK